MKFLTPFKRHKLSKCYFAGTDPDYWLLYWLLYAFDAPNESFDFADGS